ncbi:MAG: quinoprotein relay system zinc metallohydrolase 1 [Burkholderiaceae bacterium]
MRAATNQLTMACVVSLACLGSASVPAQGLPAATGTTGPADPVHLDYGLRARQIASGTWVIEGAVEDFSRQNGCNIINTGFIATGAGVVVINTGPSRRYGEQQRRLIAQVTPEPVVQVLNLNLHPDYFFGNQAWPDRPVQALPGSMAGMQAEGGAYADNLYRLCGDWMTGTESTPASKPVEPGVRTLGQHRIELLRLDGHTGDDLVLLDHTTGVVFAGGLVFADRVPTTPHADFARWQASLNRLEDRLNAGPFRLVVPSHGPVHEGAKGLAQTRDWLTWLTGLMETQAESGMDLSEVLAQPVPGRFASWAAQPAELHRTLAQWYPRYEQRALGVAGAR